MPSAALGPGVIRKISMQVFRFDSSRKRHGTRTGFFRATPAISGQKRACSRKPDIESSQRSLLTRNRLERLRFLSAFVNRCPDDCGANSSSVFSLYSVAGGNHDNPCVALPGNACKRGLRGRPSYVITVIPIVDADLDSAFLRFGAGHDTCWCSNGSSQD